MLAAIMICSQLLQMASPNTVVYSTVCSYCHNWSIAQGNRTNKWPLMRNILESRQLQLRTPSGCLEGVHL